MWLVFLGGVFVGILFVVVVGLILAYLEHDSL
jgi:uncharacterized membrane protein